jgi:Sulfotransferase domain
MEVVREAHIGGYYVSLNMMVLEMIKRDITLANGQQASFAIADREDRPSFFLLGIKKSGSSIYNRISFALARINRYTPVDVAGIFFKQNITIESWINDPAVERLLAGGNLYAGFRNFPVALATTDFFRKCQKTLLVRDPRDALVSEYFSLAYSHSIPEPSAQGNQVTLAMEKARHKMLQRDINDFVRKAALDFNKILLQYAILLKDPSTLVMKYEDVILNKRVLIQKLCSHFQWQVTEAQIENILRWADVVPNTEDKKAFIRKVVPGDHAEKLNSETIHALNVALESSMNVFGYNVYGNSSDKLNSWGSSDN